MINGSTVCFDCMFDFCMAHMAPIRTGLGYVRAGLQSSGGCRVNSEFELVSLWLEAAVLEPDSRLCFNDTVEQGAVCLGGGKSSRAVV